MSKRPAKKDKKDEPEEVWLEFRYCKAQCFRPDCKQCGYFWGPGHGRLGQHAHFGVGSSLP